MADYNVQMKQYNGTSFDNILPYASQALTLAGGGGATEIIAQARAGLSQIAAGSYVGNGTSGYNNPTVLTFPFEPELVFFYLAGSTGYTTGSTVNEAHGSSAILWMKGYTGGTVTSSRTIYFQQDGTSLLIRLNWDSPETQNNESGRTYNYVAFG